MAKVKKYSVVPAKDKASMISQWLLEHKAKNITALSIQSPVTDIVLIASASSVRHAKSLADGINGLCKMENLEFLSSEGYQAGQWILVDMNDLVVHLFQDDQRELYQLENLWHEAEPLIVDSRKS